MVLPWWYLSMAKAQDALLDAMAAGETFTLRQLFDDMMAEHPVVPSQDTFLGSFPLPVGPAPWAAILGRVAPAEPECFLVKIPPRLPLLREGGVEAGPLFLAELPEALGPGECDRGR